MKRLTENEVKEILRSHANSQSQEAIATYGEKVGSLLYDGAKIRELKETEEGCTDEEISALWEIEEEWHRGVESYVDEFFGEFIFSDSDWDHMDDEEKASAYEDLI